MPRALMVGFSSVFIRLIDGQVESDSIVVLEEPDVIVKKGLHELPERFSCVAGLVPATYQQGGDFLEVGRKVHEKHPVGAVLPSLEYSVPAAAELAAELGRRGAGLRAAGLLRDKLSLREATTSAGMRAPEFAEIRSAADILEFAGGDPVVVKPADRQGSLGVHVLERPDAANVVAAWAAMQEIDEAGTPGRALRHRYLAERRMVGPEYSVEAMVCEGEIIFRNATDKEVLTGPYPVELGHVIPSRRPAADHEELFAATQMLVDAVGFRSGILHAEWIWTSEGPTLVECAGRSPGDHIIRLIDLAYGISLRPALIEMHAGGRPSLPTTASGGSSIRFLGGPPGVVTAVEGADAVAGMPGVIEDRVMVGPGDEVREWTSSLDRCGYVIAVGPDGATAGERARSAASAVRIRTAAGG